MPGNLLHEGATVQCTHGGQAKPTTTDARVTVNGQPIVTQTPPYAISSCPFTTPAGSPLPCVTAQWVTAATRVTASSMPVLLLDSQAQCTPNGTPLMIIQTQAKVTGT